MFNILLVDDDKNNIITLQLLLEEIDDINISEAYSGKEAIDLCKDKVFDLIFMDVMMPIVDGIDATKQIKEISPYSMIIALSALNNEKTKHEMLFAGAEDYIEKPIDSQMFLQRTRNYLKIISHRSSDTKNSNAINPFTDAVYDRLTTFKIQKEQSLSEFWDYFLKDRNCRCLDISDYIRVIYGLCLWLIKHNKNCNIFVEENNKNLYIIISNIYFIKKKIIENIIKRHLPNASFIMENNSLTFELQKQNSISDERIEETPKNNMVEKTTTKSNATVDKTNIDTMHYKDEHKTSAKEFLKEFEIEPYIMDDLIETESDMQNLFVYDDDLSKVMIDTTINVLLKYVYVLNETIEFKDIAYSINSLTSVLRNIDLDSLEQDKKTTLRSYLNGIKDDLSNWREHMFVKQDTPDIHYLDASLLDNCAEIERFLVCNDEDDEDEGELDFF